jgi:exopolysaccharide biosynthesis polyprenyl glycosylphosphotransferase
MGRIPHLLVYTPFVALADLFLIHAGFVGVLLLQSNVVVIGAPYFVGYAKSVPLTSLLSLVILYLFNLYSHWLHLPPKHLLYFVGVTALLICLVSTLMLDWQQQCRLSLPLLAQRASLMGGLLATYRLLLRLFYWSKVGRCRVMVMAVDEHQGAQLMQKLQPVAPEWIEFLGYLVEKDFSVEGDMLHSCDALLLAPGLAQERRLIERCALMRKKVMAMPTLMEMSLRRSRVHEMEDVVIVELHSPHLTRGQNLLKRIFDIAFATGLLVLFSPLMLVTAIAIRLNSKGAAVFRQDRVGREGTEYQLYKFRTMVADAEKDTGPVLAQECDPRITGVGRLLRATRIDELPQLFNVLIGNMSLVGPRPERQFFVNAFRERLPEYDLRLAVKPGITGLAQVAGSYSTPVEEKVKFDLLYISDYSLMLDIWIVLMTIPVIFQRERAEGIRVSSSSLDHGGRALIDP